MTNIHIALPGATGRHYMRWTPYRQLSNPGAALTSATTRRVMLTNGVGTFVPLEFGMVWQVLETPESTTARYFVIPLSAPADIAYPTGLSEVDPTSLTPVAAPSGLWEQQLATLQSQVQALTQGGIPVDPGLSAYQLAQTLGFAGTPQQWLDSLKAPTQFLVAADDPDVLQITA